MRPDWTVVRHALATSLLMTLVSTSSAGAQEQAALNGVDGRLSDYGLSDLASVKRGRISLVHDPAGDRIVLHFLRALPLATPPAPAPPEEVEAPSGARPEPRHQAVWVWDTADLLRDADQRDAFLSFVEDRGIDRVFLYLPAAEGEQPMEGFIPFDGDEVAPLLAALYSRGALTYALDGDPAYVLDENRPGVLRTVRRVADYNRSRPAEERFFGVRYDVEPYLLPGFQGPRRAQILDDYVRLLADVADEAHASGLVAGADIPFWLDAGDEETGEPFEATLDGVRLPVLDHVMSTVDDVAIMAYRTSASGADGVLTHASGELALGGDTGAGVYVAVETTRIYDEEIYTFRGDGRVGLPSLRDAAWVLLEDRGEGQVRVWFADGDEALTALERQVADVTTLTYWFAGQPVPLPGDRLSFYALGAEAMEQVTDHVLLQFGGDPAFLGLAFHDYRGLSALLSHLDP